MAGLVAQLDGLVLRSDAAKGRGIYVSNTAGIEAGTVLFEETPFSAVVLTSFSQKLCAMCFNEADPDICCDDCSQVMYCSEKCQEALEEVHQLECEVLEDIDLIAKKSNANRDLVRLVLRILCTRAAGKSISSVAGKSITTSYQDVQEMTHAASKMSPEWIRAVEQAAELVLDALPRDCKVSVDEFVGLAARINENSYSLESRTPSPLPGVVSVGLFPFAGLVNHSCAPNAIWSAAPGSKNGAMVMRATKFIPFDHEVLVTYIDVHQPREKRQEELLATKHFNCQCERCTSPLVESVDASINGVCCPAPCRTTLQPAASPDTFHCPSCNRSWPTTQIKQRQALAVDAVKTAESKFNKKQMQDAKQQLITFVESAEQGSDLTLHRLHHTLSSAFRILGDCCLKLNEYANCYRYRLEALERLESSNASSLPALAIANLDVVDAIGFGLTNKCWKDEDVAAKKEERKRYCLKALELRSICYGADHPLIVHTKNLYESM